MANSKGINQHVPDPSDYADGPPRPHFRVNEKVLCYEPDVNKAQVLYDSKVVEVTKKVDCDGVYYSYKIHFQGWKDTWDRYVRENHVLKSTEENKALQQRLYDEVAAAKALKKKKKKATIKEKLQAVQASTSKPNGIKTKTKSFAKAKLNGKATRMKQEHDYSTDHDSSEDEGELIRESEQLVIPEDAKKLLEWDFHKVKQNNMLVRLPANITVIEIFEAYIRNVGRDAVKSYIQKFHTKMDVTATGKQKASASTKNARPSNDMVNEALLKTIQRVTFTKRVIEDIRIMFDFLLCQILLYNNELEQYKQYLNGQFNPKPVAVREAPSKIEEDPDELKILNIIKTNMLPPPPPPPRKIKRPSTSTKVDAITPIPMIPLSQIKQEPVDNGNPSAKRIKLEVEACRLEYNDPNAVHSNLLCKNEKYGCDGASNGECNFPWACEYLNRFMDDLYSYELLPQSELHGEDPHPSVCYGTQHLLRLFVKIPELLSRTTIPRRKMGSIVSEMNSFLMYLTFLKQEVSNSDWYKPRPNLKVKIEAPVDGSSRQKVLNTPSNATTHRRPSKNKEMSPRVSQSVKRPKSQQPIPAKKTKLPPAIPSKPRKRRKRSVSPTNSTCSTIIIPKEDMIVFSEVGTSSAAVSQPGGSGKSTTEELSREANDLKSYSLRTQSRPSYK